MPRYFFNHYSRDERSIDDEGVDLSGDAECSRLALESLGQMIIDGAGNGLEGDVVVEARDREKTVLRVSAIVKRETL